MTLNELYAVNGDWKYNPNIVFEFHYPINEPTNSNNLTERISNYLLTSLLDCAIILIESEVSIS